MLRININTPFYTRVSSKKTLKILKLHPNIHLHIETGITLSIIIPTSVLKTPYPPPYRNTSTEYLRWTTLGLPCLDYPCPSCKPPARSTWMFRGCSCPRMNLRIRKEKFTSSWTTKDQVCTLGYTVYDVHCTVYSVHCTMYIV